MRIFVLYDLIPRNMFWPAVPKGHCYFRKFHLRCHNGLVNMSLSGPQQTQVVGQTESHNIKGFFKENT